MTALKGRKNFCSFTSEERLLVVRMLVIGALTFNFWTYKDKGIVVDS